MTVIHKHEFCVSSATPGFAHWIVGNQVWKNSKFLKPKNQKKYLLEQSRKLDYKKKTKKTVTHMSAVCILLIYQLFFSCCHGGDTQARHTAASSQTSSSNLRQSSFRCCCRPLMWIWCKVARGSPRWAGRAVDSAIVFSSNQLRLGGSGMGFGERRLSHLNAN